MASAAAAQAPAPQPSLIERQANEFTSSAQDSAGLDLAADGSGVIVWQSRRQEEGTYGIYARRFLADGSWAGGEVHINQTTASHQNDPAVALDAHGAWFAWTSFGQDGELRGIVARRTDGRLQGGPGEVLVNDSGAALHRAGSQDEVALCSAQDGRAIVVWTTPGGAPGARAILARRLTPAGEVDGGLIAVSQGDELRDSTPRIAADAAGRFVVVWSRAGADGQPHGIFARAFEADGTPRGDEQRLSAEEARGAIEPSLALAGADTLLAAWMESADDDHQPMLRSLAWDAERGAFVGAPAAALLLETRGYTSGLEVALDGERAVLAWGSIGGGSGADLHVGRLQWREGAPVLDERRVATRQTGGDQRLRVGPGGKRLAIAAGVVALAWSGDGGQADHGAAHLTLLRDEAVEEPAAVSGVVVETPAEPIEASPHEPPVYQPTLVSASTLLGLNLGAGPDFGFLGIVDSGWNPPDPHLAVGPQHLVAVANGRIAFFERNGTRLFEQPIEGPGGFWGGVGATGFVFDPEALFDPYSSRFMVCAVERSNGKPYFLLAVSDSFSPSGAWHRYRFDVQAQAGDNDIDSPVMAVDGNAVYLGADFFGPDKFLVFMLEKAALLSGQQPLTHFLLLNGTSSLGVPLSYPGASSQYMVEAFKTASSDVLRLHAVGDPLGTPTHTTFDLQVPTYTAPEDPPQLGATSRPDTFDARVWSSVFRGGFLWATHHVGSDHVRQRWYQIRMNNWPLAGVPTLEQWGELDPGPEVRTFFGSLWVDYVGNMGMVFSRSSPSEFISAQRTYRLETDPPGTLRPAEPLQISTGPELTGRWGDYSAVGCDPAVPGIFWGIGQYRSSTLWSTWISAFGPCSSPAVYCTPKVTSLLTTPSIGWSGVPSISKHNFHLTLTGGVPLQVAVFLESSDSTSLPFLGGVLCVAPPLQRSDAIALDPLGQGSAELRFGPDELGATKSYQFWFRDPLHPDQTGTGLSDGLQITVGP